MRRSTRTVFKNDSSMDGTLPRPHERPCCAERGKVGHAHWRSGKKRHTNRLRRRIDDKAVVVASLEEIAENQTPDEGKEAS